MGDVVARVWRHAWPFVTRKAHDRLLQENFHLRGAIRQANDELRRHRELLARLRSGERTATNAVQAVFNVPGSDA